MLDFPKNMLNNPMSLPDHERHQISLIDEQMTLLLSKKATDNAILDALFDFIPEVRCLIDNMSADSMKPYLDRYPGFAYFCTLIDSIAS